MKVSDLSKNGTQFFMKYREMSVGWALAKAKTLQKQRLWLRKERSWWRNHAGWFEMAGPHSWKNLEGSKEKVLIRKEQLHHWLVIWNICYFSIYWECHHHNWRTHIFQRGRYTTNQIIYVCSFWFRNGFHQHENVVLSQWAILNNQFIGSGGEMGALVWSKGFPCRYWIFHND